jgi:hypothetical protein
MHLSHKGRDILFPMPASWKERYSTPVSLEYGYPTSCTWLIKEETSYFPCLPHERRDILFPTPVSLEYGYPTSCTCLIKEETSYFPSLPHTSMRSPQRPSSIWTHILTESISHIYPTSTKIRLYAPAQSDIIHKYDISRKYVWSQVV